MYAACVSNIPPVNIIEFVTPFVFADSADSVDFLGTYTKNDDIAVLHLRFFTKSAKISLFPPKITIVSAAIPFPFFARSVQNDTPPETQIHVFVVQIPGRMLPQISTLNIHDSVLHSLVV